MRAFYFLLFLPCLVALISQPSAATSLDEMMRSASDQQTAPAPRLLGLVATDGCGHISSIIGCPADGGKLTPPETPELLAMIEAMPRLMNLSMGTTQDKLELLRTANTLGKLTPQQITAQLATLKASPASQQLAVLPRVVAFLNTTQQADPLKSTELLIRDVTEGGSVQLERGVRQARQFLASIEPTVSHLRLKNELRQRIAGIDALIKAGTLSQAAKQSFGVFYDAQGLAKKNPRTGQPFTPAQISSALMLMSLQNSLQDTGKKPLSVISADPEEVSLDRF